jgi:dolichyl-diphosphooligosaccharide--protein glycosyltransferase
VELDNGLVKVEKSSHYVRYLLIIGILALSFSLSFMIRAQPLEYGFELNEFDPIFNYRATQFMIENGFPAYLEWHDDLSWHPYGRNVSVTSQDMLHSTTATLYQIFGMDTSLYDFTILFPVVIGSLTTIIIFAIVRTIGGTTAGLFASLFFAVSPIIIMRGSIGWFKSEPLGLFYGLLAVYLLLSAIKSDKGKVSVAKIVGGGILLSLGLASWGGIQFFILPIGLFFMALPFLRKDNKFIIWASVVFTSEYI